MSEVSLFKTGLCCDIGAEMTFCGRAHRKGKYANCVKCCKASQFAALSTCVVNAKNILTVMRSQYEIIAMSVRPHQCFNSETAERILMKFGIWCLCSKLSGEFNFNFIVPI
jgi:hypothetical protein